MRVLKPFLITTSLLFALFVVLLPLVKENNFGFAQTETKTVIFPLLGKEATPSASPLSTPKAEKAGQKVDYYLAYPGILPDHPLYWAKMIRDRILLIFTRDSEAVFQRLIIYADKRIGAAEVLVKGGKESLGVSTATKAEKYLQQAAEQLEKLKKEGKMTAILADQTLRGVVKHGQILEDILTRVEKEKGVLQSTIELNKQIHQKVLQIIGKE